MIEYLISLYDKTERIWNSKISWKFLTGGIVTVFFVAFVLIELNRQALLPEFVSERLPFNHFYAVSLAFSMLLIVEVIGLVFVLTKSVAESVGKQFEILSLILLRQSFKEFVNFSEPIHITEINEPILHILSNSFGALFIFAAVGLFYRIQTHRAITFDKTEQLKFIAAKKIISLSLLLIFAVIGIHNLISTIYLNEIYSFFETFYLVLIFADVLIVLVSLRFSSEYFVLFRNSGFALTTVIIRMALSAEPYMEVVLGISAAILVLGISFTYNKFCPECK